MKKVAKLDLIDVPWPMNLFKCSRHTGDMQPGDEMVITLKDEGVKKNLLLILNGMPGISVEVSTAGACYAINVTKTGAGTSTRDGGISS